MTKVLVVDDEKLIVKGIRFSLEQDGMEVTCAYDGEEALLCAKEQKFDMILLDIMLPKLSGTEVCQQIREFSDVPIVMLTAKNDDMDKIMGLEYGADDYITKPFSATYLKIRIKSLLHQRKELQEIYWKAWSEKLNNTQETTLEEKLTPSQPQIISYDEQFMQQVMQVMEEQMENSELTVDEFAQLLNLGRSVFYQKLKSIIGLSPVDFIREIRIKRAVQLIDSGEYNFSQVAYMTGFNDPKYFGKCFKRQMGMTPSEYKENKRDDS
mgnify:CR=1 FL=1